MTLPQLYHKPDGLLVFGVLVFLHSCYAARSKFISLLNFQIKFRTMSSKTLPEHDSLILKVHSVASHVNMLY